MWYCFPGITCQLISAFEEMAGRSLKVPTLQASIKSADNEESTRREATNKPHQILAIGQLLLKRPNLHHG